MEPLENFSKMSAFDAFSSNLEAEPLRRSGVEPPENFDKNDCFRSMFQQSYRGKALAGIGSGGGASENF